MCVYVCFSFSEVFAEALCSEDYSQCLAELEVVPASSLWPKNNTLRALASLLTADDPQVNKAAADYLSSGASRGHFRTRVSSAKERAQVDHFQPGSWLRQMLHVMFECALVSTGCGVLHPGTVGGWGSEPEGGLFSSQLSAGQWPVTLSIAVTLVWVSVCVLCDRDTILIKQSATSQDQKVQRK